MVNSKETAYAELSYHEIKWCSVSLNEIIAAGKRLEASVFCTESKHAFESVIKGKYGFTPLKELMSKAYYPGRFKRTYTTPPYGLPFYLPSQMTDIYPKAEKRISRLTKCDINELRLKFGDVLLTRSGTIGSLTLVSKTLENTIFSDDVIRVTVKNNLSGFIYAFLRSSIGNTLLQTNNYGAVIQHIEPEHLADIPIPNPPDKIKTKINDLILRSFELRDESNELIDKATAMLIEELKLLPLEDFQTEQLAYSVKLSELNGRLDGSYHLPIVKAIKEHLCNHAAEVTTVGDNRITKQIILAGVFKRVYVDESHGIPFLGGKEITQLAPKTEKYLSRSHHSARYKKELYVSKNMILVTDRGSIGTVAIVPKHWEGWAVSQNVLKVVPASDSIAGYLFIFLNSCWGKFLIQRQTYGAVVDMIDDRGMANIEFPLLKDEKKQTEINALALEANKLRYKAYQLEREAMSVLENEVITQ